MPILSAILGFLKINWMYVGGAILVATIWWKVSHAWSDYKDWKANQAQTITELTVSRDRAIVERASAQAAMAEKQAHVIRLEILLDHALEEQKAVTTIAKEQQDIFERHNFTALTKAKPGLIEKMANKATQERMDAFEKAFNE